MRVGDTDPGFAGRSVRTYLLCDVGSAHGLVVNRRRLAAVECSRRARRPCSGSASRDDGRRLGTLVASDSGVWLERGPDTVREPDVAFTSAEKIPLDAEIDGYAEVVPDLVVEIVSPSDSRRWARDRAQMWLDYGAPLVWIVHPDTSTIDAYRPGAGATTLHEDDSLDGHDILPGFTCPVSTIFG